MADLNYNVKLTGATEAENQLYNISKAAIDMDKALRGASSSSVDAVTKSIKEMGKAFEADVGAVKNLGAAMNIVRDVEMKAKEAADALAKAQAEVTKEFNAALRPADALAANFSRLMAAGVSASNILKVYGNEISKAAATHEKFGQALPPLIANLQKTQAAMQGMASSGLARFLDNAGQSVSSLAGKIGGLGGPLSAAGNALQSLAQKVALSFGGGGGGPGGGFLGGMIAQLSTLPGLISAAGAAFASWRIGSSIIGFMQEAVQVSSQLQQNMLGLGNVAQNFGVAANEARKAAQELSKEGFLTLTDSAKSLQNLLSSGLGLPLSINLLRQSAEVALTNRQAHLSLSQSVRVFTDGIKNGISTLTDSIGVTRNYTPILKEMIDRYKAGQPILEEYKDQLTEQQIAHVKAAMAGKVNVNSLDNVTKGILVAIGFLKEMNMMQGSAADSTNLLATQQQSLENNIVLVKAAIGDALIPTVNVFIKLMADMLDGVDKNGEGILLLADSFGWLGKQILVTIEGYYRFIQYLEKGALTIAEARLKAAKTVVEQAAKRPEAAGSTRFFPGATTQELARMRDAQEAVDRLTASYEGWKGGANRVQDAQDNITKALKNFKVNMADVGGNVKNNLTAPLKNTADGADAARKKLEGLLAAYEKMRAPMNALAAEYEVLVKNGKSFDDVVQVNAKSILDNAQKQKEHGVILDENAQKYLNAAIALEEIQKQFDAELLQDLTTAFEESAKRAAEYKVIIDEVTAGLKAYWVELDEAKEKQDVFWNMRKPGIGGVADLSEDPMSLKNLLKGGLTIPEQYQNQVAKPMVKATEDMRQAIAEQVSTIVTDFSAAFADILFAGEGWATGLLDVFREWSKSMVRLLVEVLINPLKNKMQELGKMLSEGIYGKAATAGSPGKAAMFGMGSEALYPVGGAVAGASMGKYFGGGTAGAVSGAAIGAVGASVMGSVIAGTGLGWGAIGTLVAMSGPFAPIVGAALVAAMVIGPIMGMLRKDPIGQGIKEITRDLGGLKVSTEQLQTFIETLGLTAKQYSDVRREISMSPKFLTEVAGPQAAAQGRMPEFLASLGPLAEPYRLGQITGDYTALNKAWMDMYGSSKDLAAALPDFANQLAAVNTEASEVWKTWQRLLAEFEETGKITPELEEFIVKMGGDLEAFKNAAKIPELQELNAGFERLLDTLKLYPETIDDMISTFIETGTITKELADKIKEHGGDIGKFETYARLSKLKKDFKDLAQTFLDTGENLEELTEIFKEFGGDVSKLDLRRQIGELEGLRDGFKDLREEVAKFAPEVKSANQILLETGEVTDALRAQVAAAGGDIAPFEEFGKARKAVISWTQVRSDFDAARKDLKIDPETGLLSSEQLGSLKLDPKLLALVQQFSPDDARELTRLVTTEQITGKPQTEAINVILDRVGVKIADAQASAATKLVAQLDKMDVNLGNKIDTMTRSLQDELINVGNKIDIKWNEARDALIHELQSLHGTVSNKINDLQSALTGAINAVETAVLNTNSILEAKPSMATGGIVKETGWAYLHKGEVVIPPPSGYIHAVQNLPANYARDIATSGQPQRTFTTQGQIDAARQARTAQLGRGMTAGDISQWLRTGASTPGRAAESIGTGATVSSETWYSYSRGGGAQPVGGPPTSSISGRKTPSVPSTPGKPPLPPGVTDPGALAAAQAAIAEKTRRENMFYFMGEALRTQLTGGKYGYESGTVKVPSGSAFSRGALGTSASDLPSDLEMVLPIASEQAAQKAEWEAHQASMIKADIAKERLAEREAYNRGEDVPGGVGGGGSSTTIVTININSMLTSENAATITRQYIIPALADALETGAGQSGRLRNSL